MNQPSIDESRAEAVVTDVEKPADWDEQTFTSRFEIYFFVPPAPIVVDYQSRLSDDSAEECRLIGKAMRANAQDGRVAICYRDATQDLESSGRHIGSAFDQQHIFFVPRGLFYKSDDPDELMPEGLERMLLGYFERTGITTYVVIAPEWAIKSAIGHELKPCSAMSITIGLTAD